MGGQEVKNVGWESLEMEESENAKALDGPATSRCGQNISGHIGFDPYTLQKSNFVSWVGWRAWWRPYRYHKWLSPADPQIHGKQVVGV